ncbi:MAG: sulfatase [Tepidisphaerales bacterium]
MHHVSRLLLSVFIASVAGQWVRAESPATMPAKRNVILIVSDDLTDTLGCYGNKVVKTPQIDRLAQRGVVFRHNYCQLAICNPSRASMMSGLTPEACGVMGQGQNYQPGPNDPPFLHRLYQANGWETINISKVFHGTHTAAMQKANPSRAKLGTDDPGGWNKSIDHKPTPEAAKPTTRKVHADAELGELIEWKALDPKAATLYDIVATTEATKQLDELAAARKPFFLALGYHKPHLPWIVPQKYFDLYKLEDIVAPKEPAGHAASIPLYARNNSTNEEPKTDKEIREAILAYYACTSCVDEQVGRLLDAMDRLKLWETTTIVLVGDNGFHLGEHGLWGKRTLFEESAAVPLIISGAGVEKPGSVCQRTVETLDIYPTVADLCGLPRHAKLMGKSLVPLLKDPNTPWDRPAYTVVLKEQLMGRSIRSERYRYTEWDDGKVGVELYDHESDPGEYHNIAADPKMAETIKLLKAQLELRKSPIRILDTSAKAKVRRVMGLKGRSLRLAAYGAAAFAALLVAGGVWWWSRRKRASITPQM